MSEEYTGGLCACMGPMYGEPMCSCQMKRTGLPRSPMWEIAGKKFKEEMGKLFGPGGEYESLPSESPIVSPAPESPSND